MAERNPGGGFRSSRTTPFFRVFNFELFVKPVSNYYYIIQCILLKLTTSHCSTPYNKSSSKLGLKLCSSIHD